MNKISERSAEMRMYNGRPRKKYVTGNIDSLAQDEVFVFGSNLDGFLGGGAARAAFNKFGAVWGKGVGLQGQSYAIPTMHGGPDAIKPYVDEFIAFAKEHPELYFYVTRIGCGIAGFKDAEIAPLFRDAAALENVALPGSLKFRIVQGKEVHHTPAGCFRSVPVVPQRCAAEFQLALHLP